MLPDEKKLTLADNQRDLKTAQQKLLQRSEDSMSCFESMASLNRAALTMCLAPELDEEDLAALGEVLMLQSALIQAAYAHYRLRDEIVTTKQSGWHGKAI